MGKTSLKAVQIRNQTTNFREAIAGQWHKSKPQESAVLLAGNKMIEKITRIFFQ